MLPGARAGLVRAGQLRRGRGAPRSGRPGGVCTRKGKLRTGGREGKLRRGRGAPRSGRTSRVYGKRANYGQVECREGEAGPCQSGDRAARRHAASATREPRKQKNSCRRFRSGCCECCERLLRGSRAWRDTPVPSLVVACPAPSVACVPRPSAPHISHIRVRDFIWTSYESLFGLYLTHWAARLYLASTSLIGVLVFIWPPPHLFVCESLFGVYLTHWAARLHLASISLIRVRVFIWTCPRRVAFVLVRFLLRRDLKASTQRQARASSGMGRTVIRQGGSGGEGGARGAGGERGLAA
eukprot:scaffold2015_cov92-Isochrysis_galbana.AAC.2